jgi:hypothetical protein
MATDFFGYDRTVAATDTIASSEALVLSGIGGAELIQSISLQYGQQIRSIFAVGTSNIYFVGGQSQGALDFERLSACGDMLAGLQGNCGKLEGAVSLGGGGAASCFCAPGGITMSDLFIENVSVRARAGQIEILEGGRIRIGTLHK